jgi:7-carboxy-7-deazaguanine synthase
MYSVKEIYYTMQGEGAQTGRAAVFCRFAGCNLWSGREADRASAICQFCDTDFADTNGPGGGKFATAEGLADAVAETWGVRGLPGLKSEISTPASTDHSPGTPGTAGTQLSRRDEECAGQVTRTTAGQETGGTTALPPQLAKSGPAGDPALERGAPEFIGRRFVVCTGGEPLLQLDEPLIAALHARGFEIAVETNGTVAAPAGIDWICVSPKAGARLVQTTGDELKLVYPQVGAEPERFEQLGFRNFFLQPMDGPVRDANTKLALGYCLSHPRWRMSLQTHKLLGIP